MAKKEKEVVETKETMSPLVMDFGRADLNELRDKVNEIIAKLS